MWAQVSRRSACTKHTRSGTARAMASWTSARLNSRPRPPTRLPVTRSRHGDEGVEGDHAVGPGQKGIHVELQDAVPEVEGKMLQGHDGGHDGSDVDRRATPCPPKEREAADG